MTKKKFISSDYFQTIILDNICLDGYDLENTDPILAINEIFCLEYGHEIKRLGRFMAFEEWLKGLPSSLTIPFYNQDILESAKSRGKVFKTERSEDVFLRNYFREASYNYFILLEKKQKLN